MGFYLTPGGAVYEMDAPAEGTHVREHFDEQVANGELKLLDADAVGTVVETETTGKGESYTVTRFILKDGYHATHEPPDETEPDSASTADESEVPDGTVAEILEWAGDDRERAADALEAEQASQTPRSTLIEALEAIVGA